MEPQGMKWNQMEPQLTTGNYNEPHGTSYKTFWNFSLTGKNMEPQGTTLNPMKPHDTIWVRCDTYLRIVSH